MHVALVRNRHDPVEALLVADRPECRRGEHLRLSARENAACRERAAVMPTFDQIGRISSALRPSGRIFSSTTITRSSSSSIVLMIFSKSLLFLSSSMRADRRVFRADLRERGFAFENFANAALRSCFSVMRMALATSFLNVLRTHASSVGSTTSSGYSRFVLPAFFCSWLIAVTIFLISSCANSTAPRKSSSEISLPPPSTIMTRIGGAGDDDVHAAGFVLRQRRIDDVLAVFVASDAHRGDVLVERNIGNRECRTGGAHGEDVGVEFADRSRAPSSRSCTSLRKPSGNSGRIGRSI